MGRRSGLTDKVQSEIVQILKEGNYQKTAYELIGISHVTYFNWIKAGEAAFDKITEDANIELTKEEKRYLSFFKSVKEAIQFARRRNLAYIQKAVEGSSVAKIVKYYDKNGVLTKEEEIYQPPNWQAAAWFLERTTPKEFGRVDYVEGNIKSEVEHSGFVESGLTKEEVAELRFILRARLNSARTINGSGQEAEIAALPSESSH